MDWTDFRVHRRLSLNPEIVEDVYSLISEIDGIKNGWSYIGNLVPKTIERLTRSVIITSTGSSNRIEGNKLQDTDVEQLYKSLNIKKFKTRDEQEIAGYLKSLEQVFNFHNHMDLSESSILSLHDNMLIHSNKDKGHKGKYKSGSNRVEAKDASGNLVGVVFDPTPPYLVQKEMHELIDWYNWAVKTRVKHPLILIANFIFEYLAIHPFQDGNGRTSRLLTNLLLLHQGYEFTKFVSHEKVIEDNKAEYYLALNSTQKKWKNQKEDIAPWLLFFLDVVKQQSQKAKEIVEGDNIEHLLSEKQLQLWNWALQQKEFSRKDAIDSLGLAPRTVEEIIKKLVNLKRLNRLGEGKATRYRLN